jgi:galactose-1-phosphate uridylyltransferase
MVSAFIPETGYLHELPDGTVKQINPFTGTEVWTVPGRGNRPLTPDGVPSRTLVPGESARFCAFCVDRYLETPPEKARVVRRADGTWRILNRTTAAQLFETVAEFRRIPNLFEILSYDYWHLNYGFELPRHIADRKAAYLSSEEGLAHVLAVVAMKLRASGLTPEEISALPVEQRLDHASGFFGGGHDVVIARRHFVDGAADTSQLASSGTLTVDEHRKFIAFTVSAIESLLRVNRYARSVTVFQNWLKPAGASFDHLHKQLVAIDERGVQTDQVLPRLRANPNLFNELAVNYASYSNLIIAENDHAVAFAGFGHRYPTIEIWSRSEHSDPWRHSPEEIAGMSDLVHAMHAATGADIPTNEEWHYRPVDVDVAMPWRIMLKWRISTVAGFEGATKIYLNTIGPYGLRDRVVPRLFALRDQGRIAHMRIATEAQCRPNALRYNTPSR